MFYTKYLFCTLVEEKKDDFYLSYISYIIQKINYIYINYIPFAKKKTLGPNASNLVYD